MSRSWRADVTVYPLPLFPPFIDIIHVCCKMIIINQDIGEQIARLQLNNYIFNTVYDDSDLRIPRKKPIRLIYSDSNVEF